MPFKVAAKPGALDTHRAVERRKKEREREGGEGAEGDG